MTQGAKPAGLRRHTLPRAARRHVPKVKEQRASARARGYTAAWEKARKGFLAKHPLCRRCAAAGLTVAASVVDHIKPHRGDKRLFWDRTNWQPLCKPCHDRKTATEDGGFGRG